jgi:hypothetical protein
MLTIHWDAGSGTKMPKLRFPTFTVTCFNTMLLWQTSPTDLGGGYAANANSAQFQFLWNVMIEVKRQGGNVAILVLQYGA